jgi:hypothetical protein
MFAGNPSRTRSGWLPAALALLCCGALAGCQKQSIERAVVHGKISFAGEPMPSGTIRFVPTEGTKTPPGAAQIIDGKYRVEARGGVPVGTHRIEIEAFRALSPEAAAAAETARLQAEHPHLEFPPAREQYIPAKYNNETELKITIPPGSGEIEHNIELSE